MKRHLIYHSHVSTRSADYNTVCVEACIAGSANKQTATCQLDRISRDSMTLRCDQMTLNQLLPNKSGIAPKNPVSLSTSFHLDETVQANCRIIYTRRLSKDQFVLELKFSELAEKDQHLIDMFIEKSLRGKHIQQHSYPLQPAETAVSDTVTKQKPSLHHLRANTKTVYSKVA
jgi:hypothetical protein